jgi:hypothetical protein
MPICSNWQKNGWAKKWMGKKMGGQKDWWAKRLVGGDLSTRPGRGRTTLFSA